MRKIIKGIAAFSLFLIAVAWRLLDVIGRGGTLMDMPYTIQHVQSFILNHQDFAYQAAPWFVMTISLAFLAFLQWPHLLRFGRRDSVQPNVSSANIPDEKGIPKTLYEHYQSDFSNTLKVFNTLLMNSNDKKNSITIEWCVCTDYAANAKFISFYVPHNPKPYEACISLADQYKMILEYADKNVITSGKQAGDLEPTHSKKMPFSGRIYLYHFDELSLQDLGFLSGAFEAKGLSLIPRGQNYATTRWLQERASLAS